MRLERLQFHIGPGIYAWKCSLARCRHCLVSDVLTILSVDKTQFVMHFGVFDEHLYDTDFQVIERKCGIVPQKCGYVRCEQEE